MVKKKGFTLVETVISMLIFATFAMGALSIITKPKPRIEISGLHGQYGCWYEGGKYYQWRFDERTPRDNEDPQEVSKCTFTPDLRAQSYYVLATGAGGYSGTNTGLNGEVLTFFLNDIDGKITIEPGKDGSGDAQSTTIEANGIKTIVKGSRGYYVGSDPTYLGIPVSNIKSCRLATNNTFGGTSCSIVTQAKYDASGVYTGVGYHVFINGKDDTIPMSNIQQKSANNNNHGNFTSVNQDVATIISNPNGQYYQGTGVNTGNTYKFNFEFNNSDYMVSKYLIRHSNNSLVTSTTPSKMARIVERITIRRQSALTDKFKSSGLNPGAPGKAGAVLILW